MKSINKALMNSGKLSVFILGLLLLKRDKGETEDVVTLGTS